MVRLEEIEFSELPKYVYKAFKADTELLEKWHIHRGDAKSCTQHTLATIENMALTEDFRYYAVMLNKSGIGFTVVGENFLYSFGIAIKHRNKEIINVWWELIKGLLGKEFGALLWTKNKRVIDFLIKNGMQIAKETNLVTTLIYI